MKSIANTGQINFEITLESLSPQVKQTFCNTSDLSIIQMNNTMFSHPNVMNGFSNPSCQGISIQQNFYYPTSLLSSSLYYPNLLHVPHDETIYLHNNTLICPNPLLIQTNKAMCFSYVSDNQISTSAAALLHSICYFPNCQGFIAKTMNIEQNGEQRN